MVATVQGDVTMVVSPLVSLIHDQVTKLRSIGIEVEHLAGDDKGRQTTVLVRMWKDPAGRVAPAVRDAGEGGGEQRAVQRPDQPLQA